MGLVIPWPRRPHGPAGPGSVRRPYPRRLAIALALSLLAGCSAGGDPVAARSCEDLEAAQAAFLEYLWTHNHSAVGMRARAVFVALPDDDAPGRDFLARLDAIPVPVGPASEALICCSMTSSRSR